MMYSAIVTRIYSQVAGLAQVGAAASLEDAIADMRSWPCAYLFSPAEKAQPNEDMTTVFQAVDDTVGILLGVQNLADGRGQQALVDIDTLRPQLAAALLNWAPDSTHEPITYTSGQLAYAKDGLYVWLDTFSTRHFLRA